MNNLAIYTLLILWFITFGLACWIYIRYVNLYTVTQKILKRLEIVIEENERLFLEQFNDKNKLH